MSRNKKVKTSVKGVYKRGNSYQVTWRDREGSYRSKSVPTFEQARRLKGQVEYEKSLPVQEMSKRVRFEDFAREWIESYVGKRTLVRDRTKTDYLRQLENHIFPKIGTRTLADISPGDLQDIVNGLLSGRGAAKRKLAPSTVRRVFVPVHRVFRYAINKRLLMIDPSMSLDIPSDTTARKKTRVLVKEDLSRLVAEIPEEHRLLVETIAVTGIRWSEAAALTPERIDPQDCLVHIRRSGVNGRVQALKTQRAERSIRISQNLWERLRKRAEERTGERFLFSRLDGSMLADNHMRCQVLKKAAERAGLGEIGGFHTLRHTAGSLLYANGANISQVQAYLGHSSPSFTHNTYVHLLGNEKQPVLEIDPTPEG